MNWEQIKEMVNHGVTIGHHTKNHLHLVTKEKEEIISEIEEANNDFLKNLGCNISQIGKRSINVLGIERLKSITHKVLLFSWLYLINSSNSKISITDIF